MRIGHKMQQVAEFVKANEGCLMIEAAREVGPHGSLRYGYAAIHRAIAGWLLGEMELQGGSWKCDWIVIVGRIRVGVGRGHKPPHTKSTQHFTNTKPKSNYQFQ